MDNKLLELQKRLKPIKKDSVNPHFKNSYFDINSVLEVVMPILNDLGLTLNQPIRVLDGKNVINTHIADGEEDILFSQMLLPELTDPQKLGSCITYYRRYSLVSLLALEAEDDDANVASGHTQAKTYAPQTQDYEAQGLIRFNPPYMADKDDFTKLTTFLKQNGGKFDSDNKCWWVGQDLSVQLQDKLNNK